MDEENDENYDYGLVSGKASIGLAGGRGIRSPTPNVSVYDREFQILGSNYDWTFNFVVYAYIVFAKKLCEYKTLVLQINIVVDAKMILDDNKKYYINIQVCRCCTTTNYFQSMLVIMDVSWCCTVWKYL